MDNNRLIAQQEYESNRKQGLITWLLWLFLGSVGVHRYYLGDTKQGILMTVAGLCFWVPGLIWCLIDGLSVNKRIRGVNLETWQKIAQKYNIEIEPIPESAQ